MYRHEEFIEADNDAPSKSVSDRARALQVELADSRESSGKAPDSLGKKNNVNEL